MKKEDILDFIKLHKQELTSRFGVVKIGLFGSYARDEQGEDSDIDVAVELDSPNAFRSFFGLKAYLEDNLHKKIDLGIESVLKPAIKDQILREIIYA